jgi:hypothetical protein
MKKSKRIAIAVILDVGFLAFLYFAPVVYFSTLGMPCPPEYVSGCAGYYESIVLVATYQGGTSGYGLRLTGDTAFVFYGNQYWIIALP